MEQAEIEKIKTDTGVDISGDGYVKTRAKLDELKNLHLTKDASYEDKTKELFEQLNKIFADTSEKKYDFARNRLLVRTIGIPDGFDEKKADDPKNAAAIEEWKKLLVTTGFAPKDGLDALSAADFATKVDAFLETTATGLKHNEKKPFRGGIETKGQGFELKDDGILVIPMSASLLDNVVDNVNENRPNIDQLSYVAGEGGIKWGDSTYTVLTEAPVGEARARPFGTPLKAGAYGSVSKVGENEIGADFLPADKEPIDIFTGVAKDVNSVGDFKAYVIDQHDLLKKFDFEDKKRELAELEANPAKDSKKLKKLQDDFKDIADGKKEVIEIDGTQYIVKGKDKDKIQMVDGKPAVFDEPKIVLATSAEEAKNIFAQTWDEPKDAYEKIGGITEFKDQATFDKWLTTAKKTDYTRKDANLGTVKALGKDGEIVDSTEAPKAPSDVKIIDTKSANSPTAPEIVSPPPPAVPEATTSEPVKHPVQNGEGLLKIAKEHFGAEDQVAGMLAFMAVNGINNKNQIKSGAELIIPTEEQLNEAKSALSKAMNAESYNGSRVMYSEVLPSVTGNKSKYQTQR